MRILPIPSPYEGYEPPSLEGNQEEGQLDLTHEAFPEIIEESHLSADTLILRCRLKPLPILDKAITLQHISEGALRKPALLYDESSALPGCDRECQWAQWRGIACEYTGIGFAHWEGKTAPLEGKTWPKGQIEGEDILYTKPFQIETKDATLRTRTLQEGHLLVTPPGQMNTQILHGYGGYYKEGIALEDIQQMYYALTSYHENTRIRLLSSSQLATLKLPPPFGGPEKDMNLIYLSDLKPEEYLSLPGALAAGFARLKVTTELGTTEFTSTHCEPVKGHPTLINIHFKP